MPKPTGMDIAIVMARQAGILLTGWLSFISVFTEADSTAAARYFLSAAAQFRDILTGAEARAREVLPAGDSMKDPK